MNYSELLNDFMENSLPSSHEDALFHALAGDEELRFEMKSLMRMREAIREDDEGAVIPISSTNAIFSRLGYSVPAAVGVGGAAVANSGIFSSARIWGTHLLAVTIGALLTTGIFFAINDSGSATDPSTTEQIVRNDGAGSSLNSSQSNGEVPGAASAIGITSPDARDGMSNGIPVTAGSGSSERSTDRGLISGTQRESSRESSLPGKATDRNEQSPSAKLNESDNGATTQATSPHFDGKSNTATNDPASVQLPSATERLSLTTIDDLSDDSFLSDANMQSKHESSELYQRVEKDLSIGDASTSTTRLERIEARTSAFVSPLTQSQTSLPDSYGNWEQFSVGLSVRLNSSVSVLLEGGQEMYRLRFEDEKGDGRILVQEVEPMIQWAALNGRYAPFGTTTLFGRDLTPFVQLGVGLSEGGPMARLSANTRLDFTDRIGLVGGVGFSAISYRFQGQSYESTRLAGTIGISFNPFEN